MISELLKTLINGIIFLFALIIIGSLPYAAFVVSTISIVGLFVLFYKSG